MTGAPEFTPFPSIARLSRGVVVFHEKTNTLFKKTLDKNDTHKGAA